ncbi:MAG: HAD family phosphatase [Blautia sp.]|nr:HAD family phosphatase [Blautia sp.]
MKTAAIYDMDGLLFDTERIFQEAWHREAQKLGVSLPDSFANIICGTSGERQVEIVRQYYPGVDPNEIMKRVQNASFEAETIFVKKGVFEILSGMKERGMVLAVASSSPLFLIEKNLEKTNTAHFFDTVVSGTQVSRGKPEPDIFLLAAEKAGVPPTDCYVFEDSINGIIAGTRAGCASIMIPDLIEPTEEVKQIAAGIFEDLSSAWHAIVNGEVQ